MAAKLRASDGVGVQQGGTGTGTAFDTVGLGVAARAQAGARAHATMGAGPASTVGDMPGRHEVEAVDCVFAL